MSNTKKEATKKRTQFLIRRCIELNVFCEEFNSKSFRLARLGKIIDYYPQSNKCFHHCSHEWGIVDNLANFLTFEFAPK